MTLPRAAEVFGIGVKTLRAAVKRGDLPIYSAGAAWPRVKVAELDLWLRSTRVPVTGHATARVGEVLEREARSSAV